MGYQKAASYICLISYWFFGNPISYILGFYVEWNFSFLVNYDTKTLSLAGLWMGIIVSVSMVAVSFCYMIFNADWVELADKVAKKLHQDLEKLERLVEKDEKKA